MSNWIKHLPGPVALPLLERTVNLIAAVEWTRYSNTTPEYCPSCKEQREPTGHLSTCALAALLKDLREAKG